MEIILFIIVVILLPGAILFFLHGLLTELLDYTISAIRCNFIIDCWMALFLYPNRIMTIALTLFTTAATLSLLCLDIFIIWQVVAFISRKE